MDVTKINVLQLLEFLDLNIFISQLTNIMHWKIPEGQMVDERMMHDAIHAFIMDRQGLRPTYCLIHPENEYNFHKYMLENGIAYQIHNMFVTPDADAPVHSTSKCRNVIFIRSYDVKKDVLLLCGS